MDWRNASEGEECQSGDKVEERHLCHGGSSVTTQKHTPAQAPFTADRSSSGKRMECHYYIIGVDTVRAGVITLLLLFDVGR